MTEWWAMSGYGPYVWGAYAVTACILLALLVWSWRRFRAGRAMLERLERSASTRYAATADGANIGSTPSGAEQADRVEPVGANNGRGRR